MPCCSSFSILLLLVQRTSSSLMLSLCLHKLCCLAFLADTAMSQTSNPKPQSGVLPLRPTSTWVKRSDGPQLTVERFGTSEACSCVKLEARKPQYAARHMVRSHKNPALTKSNQNPHETLAKPSPNPSVAKPTLNPNSTI